MSSQNNTLDEFLDLEKEDDPLTLVKKLYPPKFNPDSSFGRIGIQQPFTVFDQRRERVHEVVLGLLLFHKPPPATILDPTSGKKNRQFKPWLETGILEKLGYRYIAMDIKPVGDIQYNIFGGIPVRDKSADAIVYDPPYLAGRSRADRGEDYDTREDIWPGTVKRFYKKEVFLELFRVLRDNGVLIVKGSDFYYPKESENLFLFVNIINDAFEIFRPIALYVYDFYRKELQYLRYRMRNYPRPLLRHTYYIVLKKKES